MNHNVPRYRVVLKDGNGEPSAWLNEHLKVTNAAMDAAHFTRMDADAFARWAATRLVERGRDFCDWTVEEVPEREVAKRHYGNLIREAAAEVHLPGLATP